MTFMTVNFENDQTSNKFGHSQMEYKITHVIGADIAFGGRRRYASQLHIFIILELCAYMVENPKRLYLIMS